MTIVNTPRLHIRPFCYEDAPHVFAYAQDPLVCQYTSWQPHKTIAEARQLVADSILAQNGYPLAGLAITLKEEPEKAIGTIGLRDGGHPYAVEFSYALARPYWRRGIMFEACQALLQKALTEYKFKRLFGCCDRENTASIALLQKLGLEYEGCLRAHLYRNNRFIDLMYYSLIL